MMEVFASQAKDLVKAKLGITSEVRDPLIFKIVEGVITEMTDEKGVVLSLDNANHLMFVVDYSTWRYQSKDTDGVLPRNLRQRLHNILIHNGGV